MKRRADVIGVPGDGPTRGLREAHPLKLSELVDLGELRELCESFTALTGAVMAILDLEGNILISTGWQDICTRFHRTHAATALRCRESDTTLAGRMKGGESYHVYRCRNGLVDVAVPIMIDGEHVANFFTGQFLLEAPDKDYFVNQAEEFGFDKGAYLEALGRVRIFTDSQVEAMMSFFSRLTRLIGEMGLGRKRLEQAAEKHGYELAERQEAEAKLRESDQRCRLIVDTASEGVIAFDERYVTTFVNRRMADLLGYEPGEMAGRKFSDYVFEEDVADLEGKMAARQQGIAERYEQRVRRKDGHALWVHVSATPVMDAEGRFQGSFSMFTDITQRKMAEEELRKHRDHLEDLVKQRTEELALLNQLVYGSLASTDVGAWWIDFKEKDTYHALDNTVQMLGNTPDKTGDKSYRLSRWAKSLADTKAAVPELAKAVDEAMEGFSGAVSGKYEDYRAVYPVALPGGSVKWFDARADVPMRDEQGRALLMTGTLIDITRLKRTEEALVEAKERAEAANRAKSIFLASMSHELRTPLNVVLGFSRLMRTDQGVPANQKENLDIIVRSGEQLLNLINNVLDISKIESGRVVLEESEVDLGQLLHELQSSMGVGAAEKGLSFTLAQSPDLPRHIAVDAGKLRQVLINLIGNATKYTESGGVKLRAEVASWEPPQRARLRFEVEDSGPGISTADQERVFFPFVQLGNRAPIEAGSGLGLAISKQYVELMGGEIGVDSQPGKGAVFHFEIPVVALPGAEIPVELGRGRITGLAEGQPHFRILVAEDQPENRLLLHKLFEPLGFELRDAVNGQEAVVLFDEWRPHLIWMDIRMPMMDGLEAARRIKATEAGSRTKIIALTAHALEEERKPILAAGCDDLVRKPFREHELFEVMARHLGLKYLYEREGERVLPVAPKTAFRPERWAALPAELLTQLHQAAVELDTARTLTLIERVTEHDASIGCVLNELARLLDYGQLLRLLESESAKAGRML
jgi:PAS domain S-box-containing protein